MRVVIAEDSLILREGLARVLGDLGFEVVGQAVDAPDLLRQVAGVRPDVAITDIRMPPGQSDEGLRAAELLTERHPEVGILLLSQYVETRYAQRALQIRASGIGYLLKDRVFDLDYLADAVRRVGSGGTAIDRAVVDSLVGERPDDHLSHLTRREREILALIAEGRSNHSICEKLVISERTVDSHVAHIFDKLGLPLTADGNRRVLAAVTYLRAAAR